MANVKLVNTFSFYDFCLEVQKLIKEGYVFSDTNENFPQAYVGNYSAGMVLDISKDLDDVYEAVKASVQEMPSEVVRKALIEDQVTPTKKGRSTKTK